MAYGGQEEDCEDEPPGDGAGTWPAQWRFARSWKNWTNAFSYEPPGAT